MQYVLPFTFILRQRHTVETLLVGSLVTMAPILGHIVLSGWVVRVHRAVLAGDEEAPPLRFDDLPTDLRLGLGPFVVQIIMGTVIAVVLTPMLVAPGVAAALILPSLGDRGLSEAEAVTIFVAGVLVFALLALVCLYLLVMATNAALLRAELSDQVSGALEGVRPRTIRALFRTTPRELLKASIGLALGSSLLMLLGLVALTLGLLPATVMIFAAGGHFRAQVYLSYLAKGGAPLEP